MNPEIDKIASAAIDGEATPEELARYEGDASFTAAKEQLGAASAMVSQSPVPAAPEGLAQAQISMAMEQFRADAAQRALLAAQPLDTARASAPAPGSRWAFPRWFTPAILCIAVLGGLGIAAQNFSGFSSGSDDAASATTVAADDGSALMADSAAIAESAEMEDDGASETTEAMEDSDSAAADAPATTQADSGADFGFEIPVPIDLDGAPFVANETLVPSRVAELASVEPPIDPETYDRCGIEHGFFPPPGDLVLVVPFLRDGEPAEVMVYDTGQTGGQTSLIVNDSCEVLSES